MNEISKHIDRFLTDMGLDSYEDIGFLYQDYINECNDLVSEINSNFHSVDIITIEKLIHNLKGVSANLYVQPVYKSAEVLDGYLKEHPEMPTSNTVMQDMWQHTFRAYNTALDQLVEHFNENGVVLNK